VIGGEFPTTCCTRSIQRREDLQRALRILVDTELLHVRALLRSNLPVQARTNPGRGLRNAGEPAQDSRIGPGAPPSMKNFPREARPEVLARHWTEAGEADGEC
jgi:hypothetical protein